MSAVIATLPRQGLHAQIYAVAPGAVTVTVMATTIGLAASWTWTGEGFGFTLTPADLRSQRIDVKAGDTISIEFAGARFTVPGWRAEVREGP